MCTCMGVVSMVRWILGPEWVLGITIHIYDECGLMVRWTLAPEWTLVITI
jgi:hypothetical protein